MIYIYITYIYICKFHASHVIGIHTGAIWSENRDLAAIGGICMVACRGGAAAEKGRAALSRPLFLGSHPRLTSWRWWPYLLAVLFGILLAECTGIHLVAVGVIYGCIYGGPHDDSDPAAAASAGDAGREPDLARKDDEL